MSLEDQDRIIETGKGSDEIASGDVVVKLDGAEELAEILGDLAGAQAIEYTDGSKLDAGAVIDSMLPDASDEVLDDAKGKVSLFEGDEDGIMDATSERISYLSAVALHYYLSNYRSWIEAYMEAIDKFPAICLAAPGSPIEYAAPEVADEVAGDLGFESYEAMAFECADEFEDFPFLREVAEATFAYALKAWPEDVVKDDPKGYATAVACELRANWAGVKSIADEFYAHVLNGAEGGVVEADGAVGVVVGVKELDGNHMPKTFAVCSQEDWEELDASFKEYSKQKSDRLGEGGDDIVVIPDDDILAVAYLQGYEWTGRSWGKVEELLGSWIADCFTFCWACVSDEYRIVDPHALDESAQELDMLARSLMNDDEEVQLRQAIPGPADDFSTLDAPSRRFVELASEQEDAQRIMLVNEVMAHVISVMERTRQTFTDIMIDEIITCVYAMSDLSDPANQVRCMEKVRDKMLARFDKMGKQFKSKWKGYLASDPQAALDIKEGATITDIDDDGMPVFASESEVESYGSGVESADDERAAEEVA